jgi:hypothetical protein
MLEKCCDKNSSNKYRYLDLVKAVKERSNRKDLYEELQHQSNKYEFTKNHPAVFSLMGSSLNSFPSHYLPNKSITQTFNNLLNGNLSNGLGIGDGSGLVVPYVISFKISGTYDLNFPVGIGIRDDVTNNVGLKTNFTSVQKASDPTWGDSIFLGTELNTTGTINTNWVAVNTSSQPNHIINSFNTGTLEFPNNGVPGETIYTIKEIVRGKPTYNIYNGLNTSTKFVDFSIVRFDGNERRLFVFITNDNTNRNYNIKIELCETPHSLMKDY